MNFALEVSGLSLSYDLSEDKACAEKHWVFKDLSFRIKPGEFILMAGHTGCGKSSLMNVINGVIPNLKKAHVEGEIYVQGKRITGNSVRERTRLLGSVFQNAREQIIFDEVSDEIVFPMENIGETPSQMSARLKTLLNMIALLPDAKTATLSGGEKQKLITACTLAMGQKILLLDEPLANMDINSARELLKILKELSEKESYTVLLIEHRQDLVLPYANRVFSFRQADLDNVNISLNIWENKDEYQDHHWSFACQKTSESEQKENSSEILFSVENMDFQISNRILFENFSWEIRRGERWVILGENGCGKTTLLKLLYGFEKPSAGKIFSLYKKKDRRKKIAYVLQNPDYQLFMPKVKDELYLNSKSPEFVEELIQFFGFKEFLNRHPLSLSEGQKRKLGFACILATEPEILFLDEPTVGLDNNSIEQLLDALNNFQLRSQQAITVISVSHDRRAIPFLGNRYLKLNKLDKHRQL